MPAAKFCYIPIHELADSIDGTTAKGGFELFKVKKMPNTVGLILDVALVRPSSTDYLM